MTDWNEFAEKCKELCPHCRAGERVRYREFPCSEWVHDFSFGAVDPKTGRPTGMGHGLCQANEFRKQNGQ